MESHVALLALRNADGWAEHARILIALRSR
jgi:hypothetical protein